MRGWPRQAEGRFRKEERGEEDGRNFKMGFDRLSYVSDCDKQLGEKVEYIEGGAIRNRNELGLEGELLEQGGKRK